MITSEWLSSSRYWVSCARGANQQRSLPEVARMAVTQARTSKTSPIPAITCLETITNPNGLAIHL